MDLGRYDRLAGVSAWFEKRLARRTDAIVCNSDSGLRHHAALGYPERLMRVVYNGIDTDRFTFDDAGRTGVRNEWGVKEDELLVGLVARLDPMKDHPVFIEALSLLPEPLRSSMRCVCVGDGPEEYASNLRARAEEAGVADRLDWVPSRTDMPAVYSACDIAVSSSYGEGFSNVIAEAMACRCPCVATDVGDSARIIGDTGRIAEARHPRALADALAGVAGLSQRERRDLGAKARRRVVREYGMDRMVERTGKVLRLW
jgi:glycosyltransferase involved in cell wall biosynthesis